MFDECCDLAAPVLLELHTSITAAVRSGSTASPSVGGVSLCGLHVVLPSSKMEHNLAWLHVWMVSTSWEGMWANVNECGVNGFEWLMSLQYCYYIDAVHLLVVVKWWLLHQTLLGWVQRGSVFRPNVAQTWTWTQVCDWCKHLFEKNTSGKRFLCREYMK